MLSNAFRNLNAIQKGETHLSKTAKFHMSQNGTLNGNAKNGAAVKNDKPQVNTVSTLTVKNENPSTETQEQKPLEDRILKVQVLSDLVERREKLKDTFKKLQSFKISTDGSRDLLKITDSKGNDFSTSNTSAIKDVVESLKVSIQKQITETEAQIIL